MSLDTVIKIGGFYREIPDSWKFHDQINWVMNDVNTLSKNKDKEGNLVYTIFYEIKVINKGSDFFFDLDNKTEILDEDKIKSLYYLNFKTSKKDSSKRYLLGDVFYSCYENKKGDIVENGNYRMRGIWSDRIKNGVEEKKSSFWLSEEVAKNMEDEFIQKFRREFRDKVNRIEGILKEHPAVVLHFDFEGNRWIDREGIMDNIDYILTSSLVKEHTDGEHVVLEKYLYKTLGGVVPGFEDSYTYKSRLFTREEIINLMYAGKAAEKPIIRFGSVGVLALPHSEDLIANKVVKFFEREKNTIKEEDRKESDLTSDFQVIDEKESDSFFSDFVNNEFQDSVKFDIIFTSIPGSPAGVFSDLLEVSDVQKSLLIHINDRIIEIKGGLEQKFREEFPSAKNDILLDIKDSFYKIFGDTTTEKKKFQNHLLKMLPKIYTNTYYEDPLLLSSFLEKVEYNIRNKSKKNLQYNLLKYNFYFLMNIQKNNPMIKISESQSYNLGENLGIMARRFAAWKDSCPIKSFEKSYVGTLSRRISSIDELVKFSNYLNEKLIMHKDKCNNNKKEEQAYLQVTEILKKFTEKYNKEYCSLGFFETYYKKIEKETKNEVHE